MIQGQAMIQVARLAAALVQTPVAHLAEAVDSTVVEWAVVFNGHSSSAKDAPAQKSRT